PPPSSTFDSALLSVVNQCGLEESSSGQQDVSFSLESEAPGPASAAVTPAFIPAVVVRCHRRHLLLLLFGAAAVICYCCSAPPPFWIPAAAPASDKCLGGRG
ncbi:unnamed protein product, partial [Phaeothamnion confervicola]